MEGKKLRIGIDWTKASMRLGGGLVGSVLLALIGLVIFRVAFVNFVDNYELGYKYDFRTGEITALEGTGYFVTPPFLVKVHTVDLRPRQVCINANQRVLNCKLVQFNSEGLRLFLSWHGRKDYSGDGTTTGDFTDILKSYAYDGSGKNYPFLTILRDLKPEETK